MLKKIKRKMDKIIFKSKDFLQRFEIHEKKCNLKLKNTMPEIKNSIMSNSMLYTKEGICSEPEDQNKYPN